MLWLKTPPKYTTARINLTSSADPSGRAATREAAISRINQHLAENYPCRDYYHTFAHPKFGDTVVIEAPNVEDSFDMKEVCQEDKAVIVDHACGLAVLRGIL